MKLKTYIAMILQILSRRIHWVDTMSQMPVELHAFDHKPQPLK